MLNQKNKKRIEIVVFSPYYPPHIGGLESHAEEFNKYITRENYNVTVFTPHIPKKTPDNEIIDNHIKIIRFPAIEIISGFPFPSFWQKKFWQQYKRLKNESYQITISRTRFFFTSLMAFYFAKKQKTKFVHIEHGSDYVQQKNIFINLIAKIYDHTVGVFVIKNAHTVIANSKASAYFCNKLTSKVKPIIIYRGINKELFENKETYEFQFKKKLPVVIFIGRLMSGKGVYDLLDAKKQSTIDYNLAIVGTGAQENELKKYIKKNNIKNVKFLGSQTRTTTLKILQSATIFVNPSYTEGLPTSVTEAALTKTAIIATDVGGTNEIVTGINDAILIKPHKPIEIAFAIKYLLTDIKKRTEYENNAYNTVYHKFNWNTSINQYHTIFKEL